MPLKDCPFLKLSKEDIPRPLLPINIINPHTGLSYATFGIIDTGADECAIPAGIASLLGHNLQSGSTKVIGTGNGETIAFAHTTKFEIYDPLSFKLAYTIQDTPIDFMPNLHIVLLGVNSFLSKFALSIDYPSNLFSISSPQKAVKKKARGIKI
ncbi:MAG: hypothetical protein HY266_05715 [Deltaproteobacteria bacterium]|nr:hypothetical protein [Deltaproteobacteria bacterium]